MISVGRIGKLNQSQKKTIANNDGLLICGVRDLNPHICAIHDP